MRGWLVAFAIAVPLSASSPAWAHRVTAWAIGRSGDIDPNTPIHRDGAVPIRDSVDYAVIVPGRIYAVGGVGGNSITAHDNAGKLLWERTYPLNVSDLRFAASEHGVFAAVMGGMVALDPNGREMWRLQQGVHAIATGPSGLVSVMVGGDTYADHVRAYDPQTGRELWNLQGPVREMRRTSDGSLLVGFLRATSSVRADGTVAWNWPWWQVSDVDVSGEGVIFGTRGDEIGTHLGSYDPRGRRHWAVRLPSRGGNIIPRPDGGVLVVANGLHAIDSRGFWLWRFRPMATGPAVRIAADGTIVGRTDRLVFALDRQGRLLWTTQVWSHERDPLILGMTSDGAPVFAGWKTVNENRTRHLWRGPVLTANPRVP